MKKLISIPISNKFLSKRLDILTSEHSKQLSFEVKEGLWFGQLQILNDSKMYEIDFQLFDVCLEQVENRLLLNATFAKIPDINAKGDFFEELGTSLLNLFTKAVNIEQLLSFSKSKIEGLVAIENEISYEIKQGQVPSIIEWFFSKGLVFYVEPSFDGLKLMFCYRAIN
ncbi:MAG: hypothetical protein COB02_09555 [Candidatus Cloacimonadota bacterium]|nr:MAG: hypothetical protein COB02_09555 [Candidatus Cloacimonadota bacterium]